MQGAKYQTSGGLANYILYGYTQYLWVHTMRPVTLVAHRIMGWLLDFCNISGS